jgi:hypothetical protein
MAGFYGPLAFSAYLKGQYMDMDTHFCAITDIYRSSTVETTVWADPWVTRNRAIAAVNQPDIPKARSLLLQSLDLSNSNDDPYGVLSTLMHFSGLALLLDRTLAAARLLGFVERQFEGFFKEMDFLPDQYEYKKHSQTTRTRLPEAEFAALWEAGRAMTLEQAIQLARSLAEGV